MAELYNKRIKFPRGLQKQFIVDVKNKLKVSGSKLAKLAGVSLRTFTDWKREKFTLPSAAAYKFANRASISIPKSARTADPFWYTKSGGIAGAKATLAKYGRMGGDVERWRTKWLIWWDTEGHIKNHSPILLRKSFRIPANSVLLAEMVGIILGDGGISSRQIVITLHSVHDKQYSKYVRELIKKLFHLRAGRYKQKGINAEGIVISRTGLVEWFGKVHGLHIGSKVKRQADIPLWIKKSLLFSKACVRGLIDTDGSVFSHKYKVAGKEYTYKKLAFTNASKPLLYFVYETLSRLGLRPRLARKDGDEREVRLDSKADMKAYFEQICTNNPKFLKR